MSVSMVLVVLVFALALSHENNLDTVVWWVIALDVQTETG